MIWSFCRTPMIFNSKKSLFWWYDLIPQSHTTQDTRPRLNPCFVDEGASSGWSDRAIPRGRPRILPCREYLHDTLFPLMV